MLNPNRARTQWAYAKMHQDRKLPWEKKHLTGTDIPGKNLMPEKDETKKKLIITEHSL